MTPMQTLVLMEITRAGRDGVPLDRLLDICYTWRRHRRMKDPKDPRLCIRVTVNQVKQSGHLITDGRKGDRRYRIARS